MANDENLKKGVLTQFRSGEEAAKNGKKGGIKSGESRRRTAALRDTMNRLLTMKVEVEELSDVLRADGGESTYEEVITMAMIQKASLGDVGAYKAIMQVVGQTNKSDMDLEEQQSKTELNRAKKQSITGENEADEALEKLDEILKGVYENAVKQEAE